ATPLRRMRAKRLSGRQPSRSGAARRDPSSARVTSAFSEVMSSGWRTGSCLGSERGQQVASQLVAPLPAGHRTNDPPKVALASAYDDGCTDDEGPRPLADGSQQPDHLAQRKRQPIEPA